MTLKEAWEGVHKGDVMISRYVVSKSSPVAFPRLKKRSEVYNTLEEHGYKVECPILIGDIDEPGLSKDAYTTQCFMEEKKAILDRYAEELGIYGYCTTRGGFHVLWVLSEPVTPEHSEEIYKALRKKLKGYSLELDPACKDWTRLVRAPKVKRDGYRTEEMPHFELKTFGHTYTPHGVEVPTPPTTECVQHEEPEQVPELDVEWRDHALKIFSNSPNYDLFRKNLFEGTRIFGQGLGIGSRHNDMKASLAWAVGALGAAGVPYTPEQFYAWLYPKAEECQRPGDERSQTQELWRLIEWVCHAQEESNAAVEEEREAIGGDKALKRAALVKEGGYYLLKQDGSYTSRPVARDSLYGELKELGMDQHAPTRTTDDQGRSKEVSKTSWLNRHSLTLHQQIYSTHQGGALYDEVDGVRVLKVPLYTRTKLTPLEPTPEIKKWLNIVTREVTNGDLFMLHLAHMPSYWKAPCAAMGLLWPTGCGKSLLLDAIRQLIHEGSIGGASCYGGFQDHLLKTPYLLVDEGFSRTYHQHSISDRFKEYATGGTVVVNPKGRPEVSITKLYPRQVFCCESQELFSSLLVSSNKSEGSMDATYARIRMYETSSTAIGDYLRSIGGEKVTRTWTNPENPLLTRAILWLAREAEQNGTLHRRELRFGVPEVKDKVLDRIMLTTSSSAIIDHALAAMIAEDRDDYWFPEKEAFFFRAEEVLDFVKSGAFLRLYQQCRAWTLRDIRRELRKRGPSVQRRSVSGHRSRGYQVDPITIEHEIVATDPRKKLGYDDAD